MARGDEPERSNPRGSRLLTPSCWHGCYGLGVGIGGSFRPLIRPGNGLAGFHVETESRFRFAQRRTRDYITVTMRRKPVSLDEVRFNGRIITTAPLMPYVPPNTAGATPLCSYGSRCCASLKNRNWAALLWRSSRAANAGGNSGATIRPAACSAPTAAPPSLAGPSMLRPKAQRERRPGAAADEPLKAASTMRFCSVRCRVAAHRAGA